MAAKPQGVVETRGMCDERPGASETPDKAYKVTKQAVLTVPTTNLFPSECHRGAPSVCYLYSFLLANFRFLCKSQKLMGVSSV